MKEIILHMGFHKTASTSIQTACAENSKILRKKGIHYPVFYYQQKSITNHSIPIFSLFSPDPHNFDINIKWGVDPEDINRIYREQLENILRNEEKIILSGEGISTLPEEALYSIKQSFESYGFRITPVAFVRSPVSYQISAAQERVKNGRTIIFSENYFLRSKIEKLRSVFHGELNLYPFRQVCSHAYGPSGFFLNLIGLDNKDLKKIKYSQINVSLSDQATRLISYINEIEPFYIVNEKSGRRQINPDRNPQDTSIFHKISGRKFKPILTEIQHILEKARQENEWFREHLGMEYCDEEKDLLFNDMPFSWERDNMEQLVDALAECPAPLRNVAFDFFNQILESTPDDKLALRHKLDEIKISL